MKAFRRTLGVLVMIAGILGLVLSLTGLVAVWVLKPTVAEFTVNTIVTLTDSITTSQNIMEITGQALGATVDSVDALSTMLSTTATSVQDTQPVLNQVNAILGDTLPATLESATVSLKTAQEAAAVLDGAIKSLDTFRSVLSAVPLIGGFVEPPSQAYDPRVPLADSLGELAANLEGLPAKFTEMSVNLDKADDNLVTIQSNLTTMSSSVAMISQSLGEYQAMVAKSHSSMENLKSMLTNIQSNLTTILNGVALVLTLFFLWLLAAQVVILSQGWEIYQVKAGAIEGGALEQPAIEAPVSEPSAAESPEET